MYKTIMIPVDLEHLDQLKKALSIGADLALHYNADLFAVDVTSGAPGAVGAKA